MSLKVIKIIANTKSGSLKKKELEKACLHINNFVPSEILYTNSYDDAVQKIRNLSSEKDLLPVVCGGDGTINTYINNANIDNYFGIVPGGTANVVARELGIPIIPWLACKTLLTAAVKEIDVGICNDKKFLFAAGIGLDAEIAENVSHFFKEKIGQYAYHLSAILTLLRYSPPKLKIFLENEPTPHEGEFAIISNMRRYGGELYFSPNARYDDGLLDVIILKKLTLKSIVKLFAFAKKRREFPADEAFHFQCENLTILSDTIQRFQLDGEVFPPTDKFVFSLLPKKAKIITP